VTEELNQHGIRSVESFSCGCRRTEYVNHEPHMETCLSCTYRIIGQGFVRIADIHREQHEARFDDPPSFQEVVEGVLGRPDEPQP
jgi:hypothetical protein